MESSNNDLHSPKETNGDQGWEYNCCFGEPGITRGWGDNSCFGETDGASAKWVLENCKLSGWEDNSRFAETNGVPGRETNRAKGWEDSGFLGEDNKEDYHVPELSSSNGSEEEESFPEDESSCEPFEMVKKDREERRSILFAQEIRRANLFAQERKEQEEAKRKEIAKTFKEIRDSDLVILPRDTRTRCRTQVVKIRVKITLKKITEIIIKADKKTVWYYTVHNGDAIKTKDFEALRNAIGVHSTYSGSKKPIVYILNYGTLCYDNNISDGNTKKNKRIYICKMNVVSKKDMFEAILI